MDVPSPKSVFDYEAWTVLPSVLWFALIAWAIYYFRDEIKATLSAITGRLQSGSAIKIAGFEFEAQAAVHANPGKSQDFSKEDTRIGVREEKDGLMAEHRTNIYKQSRGVMLVHRIQRSRVKSKNGGPRYDLLFYVIPHKDTSLAGVSKVEYSFGRYWGNKVFPSSDRGRGFPVVTSAYGPFLCTALGHFNDGTSETLYRYADFEMSGALALQKSKREG